MVERASFLDKLEKVRHKKKKISVYLPVEMVKALKIAAAQQEKTLSALVEHLLETKV